MSLNTIKPHPSGMGDLHSKIKEGEYSIEIKETRMGPLPALNKGGERTLTSEEHDELSDLLATYKDVILALMDAHEEYEGHERAWEMGKIYKEEVDERNERNFGQLTPLLPIEESHDRLNYLYRRFYEMFPDKTYEDNLPVTVFAELSQRAGPNQAREIYDKHLRDYEGRITREEVRAWSEAEDPTLESITLAATERISNPTRENLKDIYRIFGVEEPPTNEEIEAALQEEQ